jgi:alanyl-tRNA synthetase
MVEKWRADLRTRDAESRELAAELDGYRAEELRRTARRTAGGLRVVTWSVEGTPIDRLRSLAQAVTSEPLTMFVGTLAAPPSIVLAIGSGSGLDADQVLKPLLAEFGGRGGGNSRIAQGAAPTAEALSRLVAKLGELA